MAVIRSLFRNLSAHESNPSRIVSAINETMASQNRSNMFATLFVGVFDLPTGRLHYCNAGHNSPLIIGQSTEKLSVDSNVPVGVSPDWKFTEQDALIDPGHTLFLYTDGLTEAEDSENRQFGEKRVEEMANKLADKLAQASADSAHHHAETIVKAFADGVNDFVGGATQSDDLTLLAIEYTKKQKDVILKRSITLPNDVNEIPQLNVFIDGICESLELDASTTMQLNLAVEEAVVNVMKYAYPLGFNGEVIVEGQADDSELKIIISDQGAPFDPTAKTDADITLSAEDRPIGGLGIFLVRQYMDSINYERVDGTNVLTLLKSLNK
jgi:sigma-B regulation protein RsbU (phosphoserine phosphatase)